MLLITMMFSACLDVEVSTILNPDGSLDRVMTVNSDAELNDYSELPFPVDSTWEIVYTKDTVDSGKIHHYTFKKHYKNAGEIAMEYKDKDHSFSKFDHQIVVTKKFRWFYTYLTCEEKFDKMAKGDYKPFDMYLSDIEKSVRNIDNPDSIAMILNVDSAEASNFKKDLDKKFEKWLDDNLMEEIILTIEKDMKVNNITNITEKDLKANRDTIYKLVDSLGMGKGFSEFYGAMNKLFHTNEFDKIIRSNKSELTAYEEQIGYLVGLAGFKYNLQMPGLLIDTNAETIKGSQLDWEFVPFEAYFVGTTFHAESRIINVWAFVVSGIFLVAVVVLLFIPAIKRRKSLAVQ